MPKLVPELTAIQVKRLTHGTVKKAGKGKKVGDPCPALHAVGGVSGLNLYCRPPTGSSKVGARSWILRTVVGEKRRNLGLGPYPEVSLAQAREKAGELKDLIRFEGYDPIAAKKAAKSKLLAEQAKQRTFADVAWQYYEKKCLEFKGQAPEKQARRLEQHLEDYCLPSLGHILMSELETRQELITVLGCPFCMSFCKMREFKECRKSYGFVSQYIFDFWLCFLFCRQLPASEHQSL